MKHCAAMLGAVLLAGCSSVISGTHQEIAVSSDPPEADCGLYRQGSKIAEVPRTPGSAVVKKAKYDITVLCRKDGYQQVTYLDRSGTDDATWGDLLVGVGTGWAIDSALGADNRYASPVKVTLVPEQSGQTGGGTSASPTNELPAQLPGAAPGS